MMKTAILAALLTTSVNAACSADITALTASNKVKADTALKVAKVLVTEATTLRDTAAREMPAALQAVIDFEKTIDEADFKAATVAYEAAQAAAKAPAAEYRALKYVRDAKLEAMRAAFNEYEGLQGLEETYLASLNEQKKALSDLEFEQSKTPTNDGAMEILVLQNRVRLAKEKHDQVLLDEEAARVKYEAAGDAYLAADTKRLQAQEVQVAAQKIVDEKKDAQTAAASANATTAAKLKSLQDKATKLVLDKEVYDRDFQAANLAVAEATKRQSTAQAAFDKAKAECQEVGGLNPADAAIELLLQRQAEEELREKLQAEDDAIEAAIKQGQSDYRCELTTNVRGVPIDRPARPACLVGYCCGWAKDETDDLVIETCQRTTAVSYTYRPFRAKNATRQPTPRKLTFTCIEAAQKIAASAFAVLAASYMMA